MHSLLIILIDLFKYRLINIKPYPLYLIDFGSFFCKNFNMIGEVDNENSSLNNFISGN